MQQRRRNIRKRRTWGDRLQDAWAWVPIIQVRRPTQGELACIAILTYEALGWGYIWETRPQPVLADPETAPLVVLSAPSGAEVALDGVTLGQTPVTQDGVDVGAHVLTLRYPDARTVRQTVDVLADQDNAVDVPLQRATVDPQLVRTPLPGAQVVDATFLADGRLALRLQVTSGQYQAWTLDQDNTPHHLADAAGPTAISPDGGTVAALTDAGLQLGSAPLWQAADRERPVDVFWAPDGRGLVFVTRAPSTSGYEETRVRLRHPGQAGEAVQLVALPTEWVPGSAVWAANGQGFAFISHSMSTAALCSVGLDGEESCRYVADLSAGYKPGPAIAADPWSSSPALSRDRDGHLSVGDLPLGISADDKSYAARFDPAHSQALIVTNRELSASGTHDYRLVQLGWWQP